MLKSILITAFQVLFSLCMYAMGIFFFGLALAPGVALVMKTWSATLGFSLAVRCVSLGLSLAAGYFIFGFMLIALIGGTRAILRLRLKEGTYPIFSFEAAKWAVMGSLYLMVNLAFADFLLLTPFANLLFRLLGVRLGRNVQINSKMIFDATLIEIGDNTVVGGGAIIDGHIVERGRLKLRRVKIGKNVTVGSHSTIMPGCEIGDNSIIGASAVLLKNTKVGEREIWYGVPAKNIRERHHAEEKHDEKN